MTVPKAVQQSGSYADSRKYSPHRVFPAPGTNTTELEGVIDGLDVKFLDSYEVRITVPNPYDIVICKDGALEFGYSDDGDLLLAAIGVAREEDQ